MKQTITDVFEMQMHYLNYRLGYVTFMKAGFSLWTRKDSGLSYKDCPFSYDMIPDISEVPKTVEGIFFPAQPIAKKLPGLSFYHGKIRYVPQQYPRYFTELKGSFTQYETKFSGKDKSKLRRYLKKFTEFSGGALDYKVYRTPQELRVFCEYARQLSLKTYQEALLDAGFPQSKDFENKVSRMAAENQARGYLLFYNKEPVSYIYCTSHGDNVVYKYVGYDPSYRKYSVGTVLHYLMLQSLFEEDQFNLLDYTEGDAQHKRFFATGSIFCADIYFFNFRVRTLCLVVLHLLTCVVSATMAWILKKLHLFGTIKNHWRFE